MLLIVSLPVPHRPHSHQPSVTPRTKAYKLKTLLRELEAYLPSELLFLLWKPSRGRAEGATWRSRS